MTAIVSNEEELDAQTAREWAEEEASGETPYDIAERNREEARRKYRERMGDKRGWVVYFIATEDGSLVKIGVTTDLMKRFYVIQQGMPIDVKLVGYLDGGVEVEKAYHRRFAEYRRKGEWFKVEGDLKMFLEQLPGMSKVQP